MSQRAFVLSIIAIVAFVGTILYSADLIAGRVGAVSPTCSCPAPSPAEPDRFEHAMAYAIHSNLDQANTRELLIAMRTHPELASDLRYQAFESELHLHRSLNRSAPGMFKYEPLASNSLFAADFDSLRDRYQREHPTDKDPIE